MAENDNGEIEIRIEREDNYRFNIDLGLDKAPVLVVDEDPPLGEGVGPDPSRLLGAAAATCMMSSFLFCMQKSRAIVNGLNAVARIKFKRNDKGRLRIGEIELEMSVDIPDNEKSKLERCKSLFQDFCTVSQSIRSGLPVKVTLNGIELEK